MPLSDIIGDEITLSGRLFIELTKYSGKSFNSNVPNKPLFCLVSSSTLYFLITDSNDEPSSRSFLRFFAIKSISSPIGIKM